MPFCPKCGTPTKPDDSYCSSCGANQASHYDNLGVNHSAPSDSDKVAQDIPANQNAGAPQSNQQASHQTATPSKAAPEPAYTNGCVVQAWKDIKESPSWVTKILKLGCVNLVPVLNFFTTGYAMNWASKLEEDNVEPMPDTVFGNGFFVQGARAFLISLVIAVATGIVSALCGDSVVLGGIVITCFSFAAAMFEMVAIMRVAITNNLGEGFKFKDIFKVTFTNNWSSLLAATIVPGLIVGAVALAICIVLLGIFGATSFASLINYLDSIDSYGGYGSYFDDGIGGGIAPYSLYDANPTSHYTMALVGSLLSRLVPAFVVMWILCSVLGALSTVWTLRATSHYIMRNVPEWTKPAGPTTPPTVPPTVPPTNDPNTGNQNPPQVPPNPTSGVQFASAPVTPPPAPGSVAHPGTVFVPMTGAAAAATVPPVGQPDPSIGVPPAGQPAGDTVPPVGQSPIHFGTDGWRAIIGEDFTIDNLVKVVDAAARTYKAAAVDAGARLENPGVLYVGHDCRQDAHLYASIAALVAAEHGFDVRLTADYCPTPTLCWTVAHDDAAVGGIMLTSSHNPAEYLGVKLRMADGGASPAQFTDLVEEVMTQTVEPYTDNPAIAALAALDIDTLKNAGVNSPDQIATGVPVITAETKPVQTVDMMTPYLAALGQLVDVDAIRAANLNVVVDPLYGAGRGHLASVLRGMGVNVVEINNAADPTFDGLHPEPIPPWVDRGLAKAREISADALFINDGDADRIGAGDSQGNFVNPHRIITLLTKHMHDRGESGRVVTTISSSALLDRMCRKLGLELVSTPIGFKWIYGEMERGNVMIGGEESGGIGLPGHVKERDGLLMALLLTEMMAQSGKDLGTLVSDMLADLGTLEFERRGLTVTDEQMFAFRNDTIPNFNPPTIIDIPVVGVDRRDGVKFMLEGDAWVMMRPSGTEPLIRIYAEAPTREQVTRLLEWAENIITS